METLLALAPLAVCPLMMLLMGGSIARALRRLGRPTAIRETRR
jgi:hypothetical protein